MSPWLSAEQYETLNTFAPELLGFLLLVMDANVATAKNIYEAQRSDLRRIAERIALLQQEVDELRKMNSRLLAELQELKLQGKP